MTTLYVSSLLDFSRIIHTNFRVQERLTAQEAMAHPYFAPIRAAESQARNNVA